MLTEIRKILHKIKKYFLLTVKIPLCSTALSHGDQNPIDVAILFY